MNMREELEHCLYFWKEKGDMKRYVNYDRIIAIMPELDYLWRRYVIYDEDNNVLLEHHINKLIAKLPEVTDIKGKHSL